MKKTTILLLVLCLALSLFGACADGSGESNSSAETTADSAEESTVSSEESSAEEEFYDMNGRTFNILQRWFGYTAEHIDFSGEVIWADSDETGALNGIDLAKKQVLDKVQKDYNCTVKGEILTVTPVEIRNRIEKDILSGAPTIDLCFETYYYYFGFAMKGYLADLNTLGVDLSADWWDSGAVRDLSIGGRQFYGIGDINTYDNEGTFVMLFNKDLYAEKGGNPLELYELAADGGWTFDVLADKIEGFGYDSNDNGERDEDDTYGLLSRASNLYVHLIAAGEKTVIKDKDDKPVFALDNDRAISIHNAAIDLYSNTNDVLLYYNYLIGIENPEDYTLTAFKEGRGLFYITTPSELTLLADMEDEYGILPMPKHDSAQASYYHTVSNHTLSTVFVPVSTLSTGDKGKEIGILLDALGKHSKELVTPVYMNETAPDEESKQMLELILSTRVYDLGAVYSAAWNSPEALCSTMDKNLGERINRNKTIIIAAIEETVSKIESNN